MRAAWVGIALALALTGCSGAVGFIATPADYRAYRASRVAPTFEARLAAAQRYLEERPNGAFRADVRAYFEHAEQVYYASKSGSRVGLEAYLRALPHGPHKEQAARRIEEIDAITHGDVDKIAAAAEARISGPGARERARARGEIEGWIARFLDPAIFRAPLSKAKADVIIPFSLGLPSPRCGPLEAPKGSTMRRCAKLVELAYPVDGATGSEPREGALEIAVVEDAFGTPVEVTLGGPDLFLRLEETYRVRAIASDDAAQRSAAAVRAGAFVQRAFARTVSAADACVRPSSPPVAVRLACDGVRVDVIPAAAQGEDDRVLITPLPR